MINTTYTQPAQGADLNLPDDTELPPDFDRLKYPILARHVFGLVPERPALRLVSSQPQGPTDDPVNDPVERLTWDAYVAAVDAHDYHKTVSTQRSRSAALLAWRHVFLLDEHGRAQP